MSRPFAVERGTNAVLKWGTARHVVYGHVVGDFAEVLS